MMGRDLVRPDPDRFGALRMTDHARPILRGEAAITLRRDTVEKALPRVAVKTMVAEEHASLLSALKAKRRALAEAAGVPAYVVFPDRTLIEMAEKRPANLDEMMGITGVGAKKLESYGKGFLAVITGAEAGAMHPARRKLVGRDAGQIFDRLSEVQVQLQRGADGIGKPLSLTSGALRKIAEARPSTLSDLDRVGDLGPQKIERFGEAFLDVLREA
jgi:ATP-dependent DNA helicase RecQ